MPKSVEDVRLSIERVLLGEAFSILLRGSRYSGLEGMAGVAGDEESVDAGVISKDRRGMGR